MSTVATELASPRKLRLWWLWWLAGWVMLAATINESLEPERNLWRVAELLPSDKLTHFTGYFLIAVWFGGLTRRRRYLLAGALLLAFSGALEIAQGLMHQGRTADWFDLLANGIGLATGLGLSALGLGQWMIWVEKLLRVHKG
jgi:VanZ family protein